MPEKLSLISESPEEAQKRVQGQIKGKGISVGTEVRVNRKSEGFRESGIYSGESEDGLGISIEKPDFGKEYFIAYLDIDTIENIKSIIKDRKPPAQPEELKEAA